MGVAILILAVDPCFPGAPVNNRRMTNIVTNLYDGSSTLLNIHILFFRLLCPTKISFVVGIIWLSKFGLTQRLLCCLLELILYLILSRDVNSAVTAAL